MDVEYDPMRLKSMTHKSISRKFTEQMEKFEPGCTSNYYRFLSVARRMLDMGVERFVDRQFESWQELVDPIGQWLVVKLSRVFFEVYCRK